MNDAALIVATTAALTAAVVLMTIMAAKTLFSPTKPLPPADYYDDEDDDDEDSGAPAALYPEPEKQNGSHGSNPADQVEWLTKQVAELSAQVKTIAEAFVAYGEASKQRIDGEAETRAMAVATLAKAVQSCNRNDKDLADGLTALRGELVGMIDELRHTTSDAEPDATAHTTSDRNRVELSHTTSDAKTVGNPDKISDKISDDFADARKWRTLAAILAETRAFREISPTAKEAAKTVGRIVGKSAQDKAAKAGARKGKKSSDVEDASSDDFSSDGARFSDDRVLQ